MLSNQAPWRLPGQAFLQLLPKMALFLRIAEASYRFQVPLRYFGERVIPEYVGVTPDVDHVERGFRHQRRALTDLQDASPDSRQHLGRRVAGIQV